MTPGPSLRELIATVRADAGSGDALDQLATASRTVAELEEVADATVAYFVDRCRFGGRSWSEISRALGVTKQAAHKRFSFANLTLDRFTPRARALLPAAVTEARRLGHNYVGTEHVLLALFADPESLAAKILDETKIAHASIEQQILNVTPRGSGAGDAPPFTPRATECIEGTVAEARRLGHNYVGTEHVLLALFAEPDGLAAKILGQLGATYDDFRDRVVEKLSGFTFPPRPSPEPA
ncbi:MAG TPA: Clp protease N-terminal domain-containing protein [Acidimicrobiia bacterium]